MKSIFIIFHGRFPTEKAASLFLAKSTEALALELGDLVKVTLLVPRRIGRIKTDPYQYYDIKKNFSIIYLPVIDIGTKEFFQNFRFLVSYITFSISSYFYLFYKAKRSAIIYSNEIAPLLLASYIFPKTFYEMHDYPESKLRFFSFFLKRMRWILIHNKWKMEKVRELLGEKCDNILYQPNAVDMKSFDLPLSKEEARQQLKKLLPSLSTSLNQSQKMIVYTGHLYSWKGVDTLAEAIRFLPEDTFCYFVGGTKEDVDRFKEKYVGDSRIVIIGHRNHQEIPIWQKAADVLVLPNTAKEKISQYYTSPMKLFEYMASKRAIVASDISSIREIVGDDEVIFVKADDPRGLAQGIKKAFEQGQDIEQKINQAYTKVQNFTWRKRAKNIILFLNNGL